MSTQQILGTVGFVVGAYFGYPQLGYAIGSAIGGAIDPDVIKGPSLGDIANQTSMEGVPRPMIWALSPPMGGNIIASSEPNIVRKRTRQGKGGPKVESEHVYRTYAVGVSEQISRFVRVWRNNTLVYDVSEFPQLTHADNVEFMRRARFFTGGWDQNPSPALERVFGVGTTPSYRGTAYMVMDDEELTDLRGAIPQWMFQIERCEGIYVTSRIYPLEAIDGLDISGAVQQSDHPLTIEALGISGALVSGVLGDPLISYEDALPEALDIDGSLESGTMRVALLSYEGDAEALDVDGTIESGVLRDALIEYEDGLPEAIDISGSLISGALT